MSRPSVISLRDIIEILGNTAAIAKRLIRVTRLPRENETTNGLASRLLVEERQIERGRRDCELKSQHGRFNHVVFKFSPTGLFRGFRRACGIPEDGKEHGTKEREKER